MTVVKLGCPECYSTEVSVDSEGGAMCENGHHFWDSNGVESDTETLINLLRRIAPQLLAGRSHASTPELLRAQRELIDAIGGEKARADGLLPRLGNR